MLTHWSQLVPNNYVNRHPKTLSNTWRKEDVTVEFWTADCACVWSCHESLWSYSEQEGLTDAANLYGSVCSWSNQLLDCLVGRAVCASSVAAGGGWKVGCHGLQGHSSLLTSPAQRLATSVSVRQNLPACHTCVALPPPPTPHPPYGDVQDHFTALLPGYRPVAHSATALNGLFCLAYRLRCFLLGGHGHWSSGCNSNTDQLLSFTSPASVLFLSRWVRLERCTDQSTVVSLVTELE